MQALASYLQDPDRSHGMGFRDLVAGMVMLGTLTVSDQAFAAIKWAGALGHHRLGLSGQCVQRSTFNKGGTHVANNALAASCGGRTKVRSAGLASRPSVHSASLSRSSAIVGRVL